MTPPGVASYAKEGKTSASPKPRGAVEAGHPMGLNFSCQTSPLNDERQHSDDTGVSLDFVRRSRQCVFSAHPVS